MPAQNTDLARKGAPNFATQLGGSVLISDTTILLQSVAGLPLDTAVTLTIDATDANGNPTPAIKETVTGVVNAGASTLTNCVRGLDGTTAQAHANGANVVQWFTANDWDDFITAFLVQHAQNGAHNFPPSGAIMMYGANSAPTGWLICDGSAVSRTTYAALFAAIGTTYGVGDGSTTFNLPSLKGNVPVGYNASDTNFNAMGKTGGEETHLLTSGEMPAHTHQVGTSTSASFGAAVNAVVDIGGSAKTSGSTGGGGAHNNLQPFLVLQYIVKT